MPSPGDGGKLSFDQDIKPLFRTKGRDSMQDAFDLFDYAGVVEQADAIVGALRSGQMPFDGPWPQSQVEKLQQRIDTGIPPFHCDRMMTDHRADSEPGVVMTVRAAGHGSASPASKAGRFS